ncbi:hypothetical protein GXW74_06525 [Roseomonas eburnea]|uniref:DUF2946 domain-containing protein n=1 Tax=Neoroseomonas eburnea TaxID=1346889 RepID=A0A9X9X8U8_9PROT|nr:hypothetical protein [Neoroseomonas eburnea]MBR0680134.1 hypothetical protein [Neoroseomonas eburnea]
MSTLVLFGIIARLLLPLPALAAADRAAFDAALRATLCMPFGQPGPIDADGTQDAAPANHCPLCRLPDAMSPRKRQPVVAL